jgi:carboxyl-terminal processing protease
MPSRVGRTGPPRTPGYDSQQPATASRIRRPADGRPDVTKGRYFFQGSLLSILGVAVIGSTLALTQRGSEYSFFDPVIEVKREISRAYVDQPDEQKLQTGAIKGMIETLNDPYTVYVPAAERTEFTKELTGEFVGIGAQVIVKDNWLTIVTPLDDSPALKAGIIPDDRIVEVDGKSTLGKSVDDCITLLTGEPGTQAVIVIERNGQKLPPITITRERITARTVDGFHRSADGKWQYIVDAGRKIAYLRLTQFTPTSSAELTDALESIGARKGELGGLVLDLRGNPGGLLNEAIAMADLFLKEGVIVSTKGRSIPEEVARAEEPGTLPDFPIAVIANGSSASASEVLSGALSENHRAIMVGTRTFGKGSVQSVKTLQTGGGAQLKITEQLYYLPSGRCIHRKDNSAEWGVDPSPGFYVPMTDPEIVEMLKVRRQESLIHSGEPKNVTDPTPSDRAPDANWSDPSWILDHLKDKQLAAAVRAVQGKIDTGEWTPTGEAGEPAQQGTLAEVKAGEKLRERLLRELDRVERRLDALESGDSGELAKKAAPPSLWPDDLDLTDGHVQVLDKEGKLVATLRITGPNLEHWLVDAAVEPEKDKPAPVPEPKP